MSGAPLFTIDQAREQLRAWTAALEAVQTGVSYAIGGRSVTRQDIDSIRAEIARWHREVTALEAHARGLERPLGAVASFPSPGSGGHHGGLIPDDEWSRH